MREVKVISTQTQGLNRIQTAATNWGLLKQDIMAAGIEVNNMKAIVRGSTRDLEDNSDLIPEDEFTLFLTPSKVKSGK
jgi:hypothetical protein